MKFINFTLIINLSLLMFVSCKESPSKPKNYQTELKVKTQEKNLSKKNWIELKTLDTTFVYDLRYATTHNFVHKKMYPCAKCFLRPEVAQRLVKIQAELRKMRLSLKLFDCYRPGKVQKELWKIKPDPHYVADPKKGSMHNRGLAVDLTIVDKNGKDLDMGTPFDYFGKKAYQNYTDLPDTILKNRALLRNIMKKYDMEPIKSEWWHYSYRKKDYPIEQWVWECE